MAQIRVEWVQRFNTDSNSVLKSLGPAEIVVTTGANPANTANAAPSANHVSVRIMPIDSATYVAIGNSTFVPNTSNAFLAQPGEEFFLPVTTGQYVYALNANTVTVGGDGTPFAVQGVIAKALVVANPITLKSFQLVNPNASIAYLQLFDANSAAGVTLGTTVPNYIIGLPASGSVGLADINAGFKNGLVIAATTTANGSVAVGSGVSGSLVYN